ncbi:MAG: hypothetical protein IBJ03_09880 [Gemmatimonadaceae bacterium]|nr:hypothetical protein [Gemmatimonadaceae bacterium]
MNAAPAVWLLLAHLAGSPVQPDTLRQQAQPVSPATALRDQIRFDESRFDSVTANTLRGLFEDAQSMGLPTRPLINRALEGAARRISSERIVRTVRELAAALNSAKEALGPGSTVDELVAGAEAIRVGFDEATLQSVRRNRPAGSAATALVVLTDIAGRGVPRPNARDAVNTLSRLPQSDDALQGLQVLVAKNAQRGPGMALDALNRYVRTTIPAGVSPSTPATTERKPVRPPDP